MFAIYCFKHCAIIVKKHNYFGIVNCMRPAHVSCYDVSAVFVNNSVDTIDTSLPKTCNGFNVNVNQNGDNGIRED